MPIRVLVVEDSLTVRRRIVEVLTAAPEFEVVGEAGDGKRGVEMCRDLRPDVLTLDMILPIMTGLSATEYIMAHFPTPILIVSSSTNRGELYKTYDALAAGAVDVLEKPHGGEPDGVWEARLISAVRIVSRIRVITHPRGRLGSWARLPPAPRPTGPRLPFATTPPKPARTIALGASTGGPAALVAVLRAIPVGLPVPIFVVLHIDKMFASAFSDWLADQTGHEVVCARDGEPIAAATGRVTLAPPGAHLLVRAANLELSHAPERHSCRPSVDVLFESLALERATNTVAALLTGMGRDGAQGLLDLRNAGGFTIAQDEATSVIYGMPREAMLLGGADRILALDDIGPAIMSAVDQRSER